MIVPESASDPLVEALEAVEAATEITIEMLKPYASRRCQTCFGAGEIRSTRMDPDGKPTTYEEACGCAIRGWQKAQLKIVKMEEK